MKSDTLAAVASVILNKELGDGSWELWSNDKRHVPDDPILGLEVGDIVYQYDSDERLMQSDEVIFMNEGIGYVVQVSEYFGPRLLPVCESNYSKTVDLAIFVNRETIDSDIAYEGEMMQRCDLLKQLIRDHEGR